MPDVGGDPHPPAVGFGDHRSQHREPGPYVYLDEVHTGVHQPRRLLTGGGLVVDDGQPPPRCGRVGGSVQDGSGAEEPGPGVPAFLEGAEHLVGVEVARVPHGRHPVAQQGGHELVGQGGGVFHLQEGVVGENRYVDVAVDQARDHRRPGDVHHLGAFGDLHVTPAEDRVDPFAVDKHHRVVDRAPSGTVDHPSSDQSRCSHLLRIPSRIAVVSPNPVTEPPSMVQRKQPGAEVSRPPIPQPGGPVERPETAHVGTAGGRDIRVWWSRFYCRPRGPVLRRQDGS